MPNTNIPKIGDKLRIMHQLSGKDIHAYLIEDHDPTLYRVRVAKDYPLSKLKKDWTIYILKSGLVEFYPQ